MRLQNPTRLYLCTKKQYVWDVNILYLALMGHAKVCKYLDHRRSGEKKKKVKENTSLAHLLYSFLFRLCFILKQLKLRERRPGASSKV